MSEQDRQRFERVFADHFDSVLRYAASRTNVETARDAVADTFLAAWLSIESLPEPPIAWLIAVARRKLADQYRTAERESRVAARIAETQPSAQLDPTIGTDSRDEIRRALAELTEADQELLCLLAWHGLTRSEAATALGLSSGHFGVRLYRARRRFRAALRPSTESRDGSLRRLELKLADDRTCQ